MKAAPLGIVPAPAPHPPVRTLSTGDIARLCQVAPRTVSCWIDSGRLPGFRVPGKGSGMDANQRRRVYADDLIAFLTKFGMRIPAELQRPAAAVVFALRDLTPPAQVLVANTACELGAIAATERLVSAVLGDDDGLAAALDCARAVRARHPECRILFAVSPDADAERINAAGFGDCPILARPLPVERIPQLLAAG